LHGDERGSVDRKHNAPGGPARPPEPALRAFEQREMKEAPYVLTPRRRQLVMTAIRGVCSYRGWDLLAAHIRENHVHAVVDAHGDPQTIAAGFRAYASRALNRSALDGSRRKHWTRRGSVRRLANESARLRAIAYVVGGQGTPMQVFIAERCN